MPASDLEQRLRALRQQFLEGLPARASELEAWLAEPAGERDPAVVLRVAHRLRGVAPSHGLTVLGDLAARIEDGCRTWDLPEVQAAAQQLMRALRESALPPASPPLGRATPPELEGPKRLLGYRVIAIDDDPVMRRLLALTLETVGGARAVVVASPDAMVAELERERADLVISDLMMPEVSGPELLRRLHDLDLLGLAIVVVLSATSELEMQAQRALVDPSWVWLTKPFRPPQLVEALATLLEAR